MFSAITGIASQFIEKPEIQRGMIYLIFQINRPRMKSAYQSSGTLENILQGVKNTGLKLGRMMIARDYTGSERNYQLHRNLTFGALGTEALMYIIPGGQPLISIPTWLVAVYNGTRTYKDYKAAK